MTATLLAVWVGCTALAVVNTVLEILAGPQSVPVAAISTAVALYYGAPLVALTWAALAPAPGFRHRPFLTLLAAWIIPWLPRIRDVVFGVNAVSVAVFAGLPLATSIAVTLAVARTRRRWAAHDASRQPAR